MIWFFPATLFFSSVGMVCPLPFVAPPETVVAEKISTDKSFAQALSKSCDILLHKLPPKVYIGDTISFKISQDEYESGLEACWSNLHGRLTLQKGDSPLTTKSLKIKLNDLWPSLQNWSVTPLGKGFFEFKFQFIEDMRKILTPEVYIYWSSELETRHSEIFLLDKGLHATTSG